MHVIAIGGHALALDTVVNLARAGISPRRQLRLAPGKPAQATVVGQGVELLLLTLRVDLLVHLHFEGHRLGIELEQTAAAAEALGLSHRRRGEQASYEPTRQTARSHRAHPNPDRCSSGENCNLVGPGVGG